MEFKIGQMEQNMMAIGKSIKRMELVSFGM